MEYEQKSVVVQVRVTPSLKAALDRKAAEWHLNLADYLRCLFAQAVRAETPGACTCWTGEFQPEEACANR